MAWLSFARKRPITPGKGNFERNGIKRPLQGVVLHIEEGTEEGTFGWFCKSKQERQAVFDAKHMVDGRGNRLMAGSSSAHFGNPKSGQLEQFVDTDDMAYAQGPGNSKWISVENEGMPGDALTVNQIHNLAQLMAYMNYYEGVPLQIADNPSESGLGYHSMATTWGHPQCPGDAVIRQRGAILEMAKGILTGKKPTDSIPDWVVGWWSVNDTNQYYYYFHNSGEVVYTKGKPPKVGAPAPKTFNNTGTFTMSEHGLDVQWRPTTRGGTPTVEKFTRMGWTSKSEMFGSSNKYGGLSAKKIV